MIKKASILFFLAWTSLGFAQSECPHNTYYIGLGETDFNSGVLPSKTQLIGDWAATGFASKGQPRYECQGLSGTRGYFWILTFQDESGDLFITHRIEGSRLAMVPVQEGPQKNSVKFLHKSSWGADFFMECRLQASNSDFMTCQHTDANGGSLAYLEFRHGH